MSALVNTEMEKFPQGVSGVLLLSSTIFPFTVLKDLAAITHRIPGII